jgi:hypothetical protein
LKIVEIEMAARSKVETHANSLVESAREAADAAQRVSKRTYDYADERLDELSKFGKQRPLLAMGISFVAGYFFAKIFTR